MVNNVAYCATAKLENGKVLFLSFVWTNRILAGAVKITTPHVRTGIIITS